MPSSSQPSAHKSKKRKSMAADATDGASSSAVKVVVAEPSSSAGPVWVNFPSVRPAKTTPFTLYTRTPESDLELSKQSTLIACETEDVEFCSINRMKTGYREPGEGEGGDCQYVPALYDPSTSTLHIHPTAPLYLLTHTAKRLRANIAEEQRASAQLRGEAYKLKRNDLGDTFGTKKAKSQIKAEERNKVDVSAMQGVKSHLMDSIGVREADAAEGEQDPEPSEFIPKPDVETTDVSKVYTREAILPQDEYSAISVNDILRAKDDDRARLEALPYRRSRWLESKVRVCMKAAGEKRKENLKMLYYLALLLQFNSVAPAISKTPVAELSAKFFRSVPTQVLNGLLTRFAEQVGKKYTVTEKMKTKLLAWICTLYLYVDGWSVEVATVAKDLSMTDAKVANMFKSLGCSIDLPSTADRQATGMTLADAQKKKRAALKAPVKFPKIKRRGPVKR